MIGESPGEREGIMSEDFLNSLRQTITETAGAVGKKTEDLVEIQKLRGKLRSVSRAIDLDYRKLGEIIFRRFAEGEQMDEELAELCDGILELRRQAASYKEELAGRKGQNICSACGAPNPQNAVFCMKCGTILPVREEEKEDTPVQEQTVQEAQEEVWEACTEPTDDSEEKEEFADHLENTEETAGEEQETAEEKPE